MRLQNLPQTKFLPLLLVLLLSPYARTEDSPPNLASPLANTIRTLVKNLNHPQIAKRQEAANQLAKIGQPAVDALCVALQEKNENTRLYAAYALYKMGKKALKAKNALIQALQDENIGVRCYAIYALSNLGLQAQNATPHLISLLRHKNWKVRCYAAYALGRITTAEDTQAVNALIFALNDSQPRVRIWAIDSLENLNAENAVKALINIFPKQNWTVQKYILQTIGNMQTPTGLPLILKVLYKKQPKLTETANLAIQQIGKKAIPYLLSLLKKKDRKLQVIAIKNLGKIAKGDENVAFAILDKLNSKNWKVRSAALEALGKLNYQPAIPKIIEKLSDNWFVRDSAARALLEIGQPAIEEIIANLNHPNPLIQDGCQKILERMGPKVLPKLIQYSQKTKARTYVKPKIVSKLISKFGRKAAPFLEKICFHSKQPKEIAFSLWHLGKLQYTSPSLLKFALTSLQHPKLSIRQSCLIYLLYLWEKIPLNTKANVKKTFAKLTQAELAMILPHLEPNTFPALMECYETENLPKAIFIIEKLANKKTNRLPILKYLLTKIDSPQEKIANNAQICLLYLSPSLSPYQKYQVKQTFLALPPPKVLNLIQHPLGKTHRNFLFSTLLQKTLWLNMQLQRTSPPPSPKKKKLYSHQFTEALKIFLQYYPNATRPEKKQISLIFSNLPALKIKSILLQLPTSKQQYFFQLLTEKKIQILFANLSQQELRQLILQNSDSQLQHLLQKLSPNQLLQFSKPLLEIRKKQNKKLQKTLIQPILLSLINSNKIAQLNSLLYQIAAKDLFSLESIRYLIKYVNHPQTSLAYAVRTILNTLQENIQDPNLQAKVKITLKKYPPPEEDEEE